MQPRLWYLTAEKVVYVTSLTYQPYVTKLSISISSCGSNLYQLGLQCVQSI